MADSFLERFISREYGDGLKVKYNEEVCKAVEAEHEAGYQETLAVWKKQECSPSETDETL